MELVYIQAIHPEALKGTFAGLNDVVFGKVIAIGFVPVWDPDAAFCRDDG